MRLCIDYLEEGVRKLLECPPGVPAKVKVRPTRELAVLLERYCGEIELFNPAYGLTTAANRRELVIKHILDSLAPINIINQLVAEGLTRDSRIVDVGSGAGLPGIPLALTLPDVSFSLLERMGRRVGFLRNTAAVLSLPNVEILETEMEKAPQDIAGIVCFRAFHPLTPKILKKLFRLLKPNACIAAYKGRRETVDAEMSTLPPFLESQNAEWSVIPCPVPFMDDERNLVLIRRFAV
ncbi:MAG: 16S rRNA (guanine(527)-N(7))-methyltransferase RsmG [Spirochaetaceae bacterium]|nr:16S rRNA (guanine(527)-N(7))-methyltransferase RsmG [Spirochaetaceae bacterium]